MMTLTNTHTAEYRPITFISNLPETIQSAVNLSINSVNDILSEMLTSSDQHELTCRRDENSKCPRVPEIG